MKAKINNSTYNILRDITNDDDEYGLTCIDKKEIHLPVFGEKSFFEFVLIHELTHAFIFEYGLGLNWCGATKKSFEEERVCDMFGMYAKVIVETANLICAYFRGVDDAKVE